MWDRKAFKDRFDQVTPKGRVAVAAKGAGMHPGSISRWGEQVPGVDKLAGAAEALEVSPCWLAFGLGPKDLKDARACLELGALMESYPGLRRVMLGYISADEETRKAMMHISNMAVHGGLTPKTKEPIPPGTVVKKLAPNQTVYVAPPGKNETKTGESVASEDPETYTRPVIKSIKPVNRRADYSVYQMKRGGHADPEAVPGWLNLAAGPGGYLERSEDVWVIPKLSRARGVNHAVVRGRSMVETLQPGDLILLQSLANGEGIRLPSLEPGQEKMPVDNFKREVPNDEIYALSLDNGHTVTIKRVIYQLGKGGRWHMLIVADNPAEWESYVVQEQDEVIFYAKMIGFGKE